MIKSRSFYIAGFFLLGISSLGFNPFSADPWIKPKIILILAGLLLVLLDDILKLHQWPQFNRRHSLALPLMLFAAYLVFHIIIFRYSFIQLPYILPLAFLFSLLFFFRREEESATMVKLLHGLTFVFVFQSLFGLYQFLFFQASGVQQMGSVLKWRTLGLIGNPNQLAAFLALYFFRSKKYWWSSPVQKACTILTGIVLTLTFSRGVFLALVIVLLMNLKKEDLKKLLLPGLGGILILITAEFLSGATGFFNRDSVTGRFESFVAFFSGLTLTPMTFFFGTADWNFNSPVHNQFLLTFELFGMTGLVLLLWFIRNAFLTDKRLVLFFILFSLYDLPLLNPAFVSLFMIYLLPSVISARKFR